MVKITMTERRMANLVRFKIMTAWRWWTGGPAAGGWRITDWQNQLTCLTLMFTPQQQFQVFVWTCIYWKNGGTSALSDIVKIDFLLLLFLSTPTYLLHLRQELKLIWFVFMNLGFSLVFVSRRGCFKARPVIRAAATEKWSTVLFRMNWHG